MRHKNKTGFGILMSLAMMVFSSGAMEHSVAELSVFGTAPAANIPVWQDACYRIMDDPSSINRYAFETYHQYVVYCVERDLIKRRPSFARDLLAKNDLRMTNYPS